MNFEIIILAETFAEEKNFDRLERRLPETHTWRWTAANRSKVKGRASAGMVVGCRKGHNITEFWSNQMHSVIRMRIEV